MLMNKNYGEDLMTSPHPPPWLLKILQIENVVWNELPEELQLTLPYCPIEVAQEVIRLYKLKMEEIENENDLLRELSEELERLLCANKT